MLKFMWRWLKNLDLQSLDNLCPIALIASCVSFSLLVASGGGLLVDPQRLENIYTDVALGITAGIFAVVVSLSLVAIQFASQEYGHRIMALYTKSAIFWSTIIVYLGLLIATILLEAVFEASKDPKYATMIVAGAILALTLLLPHFVITAHYLRPEFIIKKLLRRIDSDYLQEAERQLQEKEQAEESDFIPALDGDRDRLIPVVEIVIRSINRDDLATTRTAMEHLEKTYTRVAESSEQRLLDWYFLYKAQRIGVKALSGSVEDEAAVRAVRLIGIVGRRGPAGDKAVEYIRGLGLASLKREAELVTRQIIKSLREVFGRNPEPKAKEAVLAAYRDLAAAFTASKTEKSLGTLADHLSGMTREVLWDRQAVEEAHERDGSARRWLLETLRAPLYFMRTKSFESASGYEQKTPDQADRDWGYRSLELLGAIGQDCATSQLNEVVLHIVQTLRDLGVAAAQRNDDATAERVISTVLRIERAVGRHERNVIATTDFVKGEIERALERTQVTA